MTVRITVRHRTQLRQLLSIERGASASIDSALINELAAAGLVECEADGQTIKLTDLGRQAADTSGSVVIDERVQRLATLRNIRRLESSGRSFRPLSTHLIERAGGLVDAGLLERTPARPGYFRLTEAGLKACE